MAPAQVARASSNTDSIKGLAQSLAKPAYRRLLVAEPALRRAVPLLIITFLITMAVGTSVQVLEHRREATAGAVDEIELFADYLASRLDGEEARPKNLRRGPQERRSRDCDEQASEDQGAHGIPLNFRKIA